MSLIAECQCGARFKAKASLAGRRVACPSCGGWLVVPNEAAAAAHNPPANSPFVAACGCGQRFVAQPHLAGKVVPCPSCGRKMLVTPEIEATPQYEQDSAAHSEWWGDAIAAPSAGTPFGESPLGPATLTPRFAPARRLSTGQIIVLAVSGTLLLLQLFHSFVVSPAIDDAFQNAETVPQAFEQQRQPDPAHDSVNSMIGICQFLAETAILAFLCLGYRWARTAITVWLLLGIGLLGFCGTGSLLVVVAAGVKELVFPVVLGVVKYSLYGVAIAVLWYSQHVNRFLGDRRGR